MPQTKLPTEYGPSAAAGPFAETLFEKIAPATKTKTNVAITSLIKFVTVFRIAGAVQNTPSFNPVSDVSFQCGKYCNHTSAARTANPSVTAGFRCASLLPQAIAVKTPHMTANAQPVVMTIHPLPSAFDFFRSTAATTPSPSKIRIRVPRNSPSQGDVIPFLLLILYPVERTRDSLFPLPAKLFSFVFS